MQRNKVQREKEKRIAYKGDEGERENDGQRLKSERDERR